MVKLYPISHPVAFQLQSRGFFALLNEGSGMFSGLRSKKAPECGDLMVHGSTTGASFSFDESACVVEDMERKKARLKYRSFIVSEVARLARSGIGRTAVAAAM